MSLEYCLEMPVWCSTWIQASRITGCNKYPSDLWQGGEVRMAVGVNINSADAQLFRSRTLYLCNGLQRCPMASHYSLKSRAVGCEGL
jgi:hypothetical protein